MKTVKLNHFIPNNFEWTNEFRPPKRGEYFAVFESNGDISECYAEYNFSCDRFILKKLPPLVPNVNVSMNVVDIYKIQPVIPEGYEFVCFSWKVDDTATHFIEPFTLNTLKIGSRGPMQSPRIQLRKIK